MLFFILVLVFFALFCMICSFSLQLVSFLFFSFAFGLIPGVLLLLAWLVPPCCSRLLLLCMAPHLLFLDMASPRLLLQVATPRLLLLHATPYLLLHVVTPPHGCSSIVIPHIAIPHPCSPLTTPPHGYSPLVTLVFF